MATSLVISCEHAGNQIPDAYSALFRHAEDIVESHEGWDPGAWPIASKLASELGAPLFGCQTSRLLIETNRSLNHPQLFSRYTKQLNSTEKERLIEEYYLPYRMPVEKEIKKGPKPVLHISVHSFTPILNGVERDVDIGLLFDPARRLESRFCENIKQQLDSTFPSYRTQFNKPYLGIDDGFTSYLRTKFNDSEYAGIEVEISQNLVSNDNEISKLLVAALKKVVNK